MRCKTKNRPCNSTSRTTCGEARSTLSSRHPASSPRPLSPRARSPRPVVSKSLLNQSASEAGGLNSTKKSADVSQRTQATGYSSVSRCARSAQSSSPRRAPGRPLQSSPRAPSPRPSPRVGIGIRRSPDRQLQESASKSE